MSIHIEELLTTVSTEPEPPPAADAPAPSPATRLAELARLQTQLARERLRTAAEGYDD